MKNILFLPRDPVHSLLFFLTPVLLLLSCPGLPLGAEDKAPPPGSHQLQP